MKNFIQKLNKNENKNVRVAAHGDPKGITLISLVITIVVLIILAGVAISMTLGENGIFTKAQEAKKMQTIATAKEQIGAEILSAQVEAIERNEELEQAQIEDIISKYGELQEDGDTIILNDTEYEVSLREIYNEMAEEEGDETTELAQLKALLSQTTVTEDKILKDYKAYKDGRIITGTMENYAGTTQDATTTSDDDYTYLTIPNNGYYTTESMLKIKKSNCENLKMYKSSSTVTLSASNYVTLECGFKPKFLIIKITYGGGSGGGMMACFDLTQKVTDSSYTTGDRFFLARVYNDDFLTNIDKPTLAFDVITGGGIIVNDTSVEIKVESSNYAKNATWIAWGIEEE